MALYGTGSTGIPFTGNTATLSDTPSPGAFGVTDTLSGTVQKNGLMQQDQKFNRIMRGTYNHTLRAMFQSLIGQVTGAVGAVAIKQRVQGFAQPLGPIPAVAGGGIIPIETYAMINRASSATDVLDLKALTTFVRYPATYAPDASGNGGGGKLNY